MLTVSRSSDGRVRFLSTNDDGRFDAARRPYSPAMDSTPQPAEESAVQAEPRTRRGEGGQGMVEYAFILVLVAIVVLVALQVLGHTTNNLYSNIANGLNQ